WPVESPDKILPAYSRPTGPTPQCPSITLQSVYPLWAAQAVAHGHGRPTLPRVISGDLPAVALSAFIHKDDQRHALLAGFQVHLSKPVDSRDLTAVIASLAGRTGASA